MTDPVLELAARQHGAVALHQADRLGLSARVLHGRLTAAGWAPRGHGVFVRTGAPRTPGQRVAVELLGCGPRVHLSHGPGAAWWGLPGFRQVPIEVVTTRRSERATPARRLHTLDAVPPDWVTEHRGLAVCRPELIVLQLCGSVHPARAERALDTAWSMGLLNGPLVVEVQSERFHGSLTDQRADGRRRAAMESAGFTVVEVGDEEAFRDPQAVVDRVRAIEDALRRRFS